MMCGCRSDLHMTGDSAMLTSPNPIRTSEANLELTSTGSFYLLRIQTIIAIDQRRTKKLSYFTFLGLRYSQHN